MKVGRTSLLFSFLIIGSVSFGQSFSLLKDIVAGNGGSNPQNLTRINNTLFFTATDANGTELWKSDGTSSGTTMVKDIFPGPNSGSPADLVNLNGVLYFSANDGVNGKELWESDGTLNGTMMVFDGNPGSSPWGEFPAKPDTVTPNSPHLINLKVSGNNVFFHAVDHVNGTELWVSTGAIGNGHAIDIYPGALNNSNPSSMTDVNGTLFFSAETEKGAELWKSNGTDAGTVLVKDINTTTASAGSSPSNLVNINGTLYFSADDGINGVELWKSDGTSVGTVMVANINSSGSSSPHYLTNVNGTLYFVANSGINDDELWKSNGTSGGTVLVKDVFPGTGSSHPKLLTAIGSTLFFVAYDGPDGYELWKSNGTDATTVLVKDIYAGLTDSNSGELTVSGSQLLFTADDGSHGTELWKSDGTQGGTTIYQDFVPGSGSSDPHNIIDVNGKIFLTVTTAAYGNEIWVFNPFVALPITSLEFRGRLVQNNGILDWKTANETNTSVFIIERSLDGKTYKTIGNINAAGNSTGDRAYQFSDANIVSLGAPMIYYRLMQKSIDGSFTYSKIIALPVTSRNSIITLYPNPVRNDANLMISIAQDEKLLLRITDITGRVLKQSSQALIAGSTNVTIDVNGLPTGLYFIDIESKTLQKQIKFIKD